MKILPQVLVDSMPSGPVLLVVAVLFAALTLVLPLPPSLLSPVFSNQVVFDYLPFVISFAFSCILYGVIWFHHPDKATMFVISVLFSVMYLSVWESKVPNGAFLSSAPSYASASSLLTSSARLSGNSVGSPGSVLIQASLALSSALGTIGTFWIYSLLYSTCIGAFVFLLANELTGNPKIGTLASMLAVLSNPLFIDLPDSLYAERPLGTLLFIIILYLFVLSIRGNKKATVPLVVIFASLTLSYVLDALIFIMIMLVVYCYGLFSGRRKSSFSYVGTAILLEVCIFGSWIIYNAVTRSVIIGNFLRLLLTGVSSGNVGAHSFNLYITVSSYLGSQATVLAIIPVWWLLLVYGAGGLIWLRSLFHHRGLPTIVTLPVVLIGISLFFLPGGAEFFRIANELSILLSVMLVAEVSRSKPKIAMGLCVLILILVLPSVAAYYPSIGTATQYPTNFAAGDFLMRSSCQPFILTAEGIASLHNMPQNTAQPAEPLGPSADLKYLNNSLSSFFLVPCSFLDTSQVLYASLTYTFGLNFTRSARVMIRNTLSNADLVYSNSVTQLYIRGSAK